MEIIFGIIAAMVIVALGVALHRVNKRVLSLVAFVADNIKKVESHERTLHKLYGKFGAIARKDKGAVSEHAPAPVEDIQEAPKPELKLVKKYGNPELSLRLKNIMAKKNITQAQVAKELGVTPPAVCQWLNGYSTPSKDNIDLLAVMLDVDSGYLVHGDPRAKVRCG